MITIKEIPIDELKVIVSEPFELKYQNGSTYMQSSEGIEIDLEKPNVKKIHVKNELVTLE